jgi:two-component system chemotaxis response regulator CheB
MAVQLGLVIDTEFLRLVLRQLVRRMPGIALVGEANSLAEVRALPGADALIVDVAACGSDSVGFAALCRLFPGRIVLIGDGETVARPDLTIPRDVVQIPMGSATSARDFSQLATRLQAALGSLGGVAPVVDSPVPRRPGRVQRPELILIAASTGGPEALQVLLDALHEPVCPIVIALHIPAEHCGGLARHLASTSGHRVVVGDAGPLPTAGIVLLQGGVDHLVAVRGDELWLRRTPLAGSVFHPNGDVLLSSGTTLNRSVVGIVLTGMGNDGCAGAKALAASGYPVLAQTPASCAVPGMPAAAIAAGAVREVASLTGIADRLNAWFALPVPG